MGVWPAFCGVQELCGRCFFFFCLFFQCVHCCCLATYYASSMANAGEEAKTCIKGILSLWPVASHTACMYGSMLMRISVDVSFIVISLCTVQLFLPLNYVQEREMPLFPMSTRPSQRHRHAFFSFFFRRILLNRTSRGLRVR